VSIYILYVYVFRDVPDTIVQPCFVVHNHGSHTMVDIIMELLYW